MDRKTSLLELTKEVTEKHANFSVSEVNDHCMRIAVLEGEYVWHFHPGSDELFIVLEGELLIDFQDRPAEVLKANDSLLIPKGVIHRTRADVRSVNLCIEKTNAETVPFAEGNVLKLIRCKPAGQQLHAFSEAQPNGLRCKTSADSSDSGADGWKQKTGRKPLSSCFGNQSAII